jgi:site-specific DNA-methyltransferase (adenine-specific)
VPIVIDKDGVIVAGHTRYKAAMELGMTEVPCVVADDLTEEQVKAFRLADNKVAEAASWDNILLNEELDEILDIDMSSFGFIDLADLDVDSFFEDAEPKEPKPEKEIQCPHCGMFFKVD